MNKENKDNYCWLDDGITCFIDDIGTKWTRGPHATKYGTFSWKFEDLDGEDFTNEDQMTIWNVKFVKELKK